MQVFKSDKPELVHISEDYDVYIGRGRCPKTGVMGIWGNPYSHKDSSLAKFKVNSVKEAIEGYRKYLQSSPELMSKLQELTGKRLGCWCKKPKRIKLGEYYCHGQVIIEEWQKNQNILQQKNKNL